MSEAEGMRQFRRPALGLLLGFLLVYLLPLGIRPLARLDEVRYGEIAREILATGDWVVPHLNGVRYFEKPALGNWLIASSMKLLGANPFAARLPGVAAAGLTALLIFFLARRHTGSVRTGLAAVAVFLTLVEVFAVGTLAILDFPLTLFLTAAVAAWYESLITPVAGRRMAWLAASGAMCGLAFLVKGFLAFAVPVAVIVPFLLWERRWRALLADPWLPAAVALAVALPWGILIHLREPDFWRYFFWVEHVRRFFSQDAQHSQPAYYFLLRLPAIAFPWVFLLPAAAAGIAPALRRPGFARFVLLWVVMPFLFFSLSRGKLISYVLPCFPPFAILVALGLRALPATGTRLLRAGINLCAAAVFVVLAWLLATQLAGWASPVFRPEESARWSVLAAVLLSMIFILVAAGRAAGGRQLALVAGATLPLYAAIAANAVFPESMREDMMPGAFIEEQGKLMPPGSLVVTDDRFFGAVSWYLRRDDLYVVSPGEMAYGLSYPDARHRLLAPEDLRALLAGAGRPVLLLITRQSLPAVEPVVGPDAPRDRYGPFTSIRVPARGAVP